jgi:hypothetical protein
MTYFIYLLGIRDRSLIKDRGAGEKLGGVAKTIYG